MKKSFALVTMIGMCSLSCIGFSADAQTYNCKGMDSNSVMVNSVLTMTPAVNAGEYKVTWVYNNSAAGTDEGLVTTVGKNRLLETYKSLDGTNVGTTQLYQLDNNQIIVSFDNLNIKTNVKTTGLGVCQHS